MSTQTPEDEAWEEIERRQRTGTQAVSPRTGQVLTDDEIDSLVGLGPSHGPVTRQARREAARAIEAAALVKVRQERDRLREALGRILENEASDYKAAEEFGGYVLDDKLREEALAALAAQPAASAEPPPAAEPSDKDRAKLMELVIRYGSAGHIQGWYEAESQRRGPSDVDQIAEAVLSALRADDHGDLLRASDHGPLASIKHALLAARYERMLTPEHVGDTCRADDVYAGYSVGSWRDMALTYWSVVCQVRNALKSIGIYAGGNTSVVDAVKRPAQPAAQASQKRRPYNASGSLSEYGIFPECDAAQAQAADGDALEDYKTNGAAAVRFAPSSAHWSNELRRLFGPDAREGIDRLEARLRDAELDAARYRWLRDRIGGREHIEDEVVGHPGYSLSEEMAPEIDAAIDAALEQEADRG
jgi:hypothetical protein